MVEFKREGTAIRLSVTVAIPTAGNWIIHFDCDRGHEINAGLLLSAMEDQFESKVTKAREDAYHEGYKDAKAKRAKKTWFSCRL